MTVEGDARREQDAGVGPAAGAKRGGRAERADKSAQTRARWLRWVVLGIVLVAMTALTIAHLRGSSPRPAGVDALCPFGGVESLYSLISGDGFIRRVAAGSLILLIGTILMTLLFRRSFCGQLCPLGALQGLFGALGKRLSGRRQEVPQAIDRPARWIKYVVLVVFAVWSWQAAELVLRPYDPWAAWAHLTSGELLASFGIGAAVLVISLAGSLLYERFFCKYLCPMGALLALFSRVSFLGVRRDPATCIDCGACDKACFMNIDVSGAVTVTSSECVACNECVNACPVEGALTVKAPGRRTLSPALVTGVVVLAMALLVGVTTASGAFGWSQERGGEGRGAGHGEGRGQGQGQGKGQGQGQGQGQGEGFGGGQGSGQGLDTQTASPAPGGQFDPETIRGYTSMLDIAAATGIPPAAFTERWGVPESELGLPLRELKDRYGFVPHEIAAWVEEQLAP